MPERFACWREENVEARSREEVPKIPGEALFDVVLIVRSRILKPPILGVACFPDAFGVDRDGPDTERLEIRLEDLRMLEACDGARLDWEPVFIRGVEGPRLVDRSRGDGALALGTKVLLLTLVTDTELILVDVDGRDGISIKQSLAMSCSSSHVC